MIKNMKVGLQLYSVREELERDFIGTLEAASEMGFEGVEIAGLYNKTPAEIKNILSKLGLTPISAHVSIDEFNSDMAGTIEKYREIGCKFLAIPWLNDDCRPGAKKWEKTKLDIAKIALQCKNLGIDLLYHNHEFEFAKNPETGEYALDQLYNEIAELSCEIDTCWVKFAGEDPAAYIRKYSGRAPVVHLKDYVFEGEKPAKLEDLFDIDHEKGGGATFEFRPLGYGLQDVASLVDAALDAGTQWLLIEQDMAGMNKTPLECAKLSIDYLNKLS